MYCISPPSFLTLHTQMLIFFHPGRIEVQGYNSKQNASSIWQSQTSHECDNKRCHWTPRLFSAESLTHPPHSPDWAPCHVHLFPKLMEHLKGKCYICDKEVMSAERKCFQVQNTNFFNHLRTKDLHIHSFNSSDYARITARLLVLVAQRRCSPTCCHFGSHCWSK